MSRLSFLNFHSWKIESDRESLRVYLIYVHNLEEALIYTAIRDKTLFFYLVFRIGWPKISIYEIDG